MAEETAAEIGQDQQDQVLNREGMEAELMQEGRSEEGEAISGVDSDDDLEAQA